MNLSFFTLNFLFSHENNWLSKKVWSLEQTYHNFFITIMNMSIRFFSWRDCKLYKTCIILFDSPWFLDPWLQVNSIRHINTKTTKISIFRRINRSAVHIPGLKKSYIILQNQIACYEVKVFDFMSILIINFNKYDFVNVLYVSMYLDKKHIIFLRNLNNIKY